MWIVANEGWSTKDKENFKYVANSLGSGIQFITGKLQLFEYIDTKDGHNRTKDPIRSFTVLSHRFSLDNGVVYASRHSDANFRIGDSVIIAIREFNYAKQQMFGRIVGKW